jgi:hypothetical protein
MHRTAPLVLSLLFTVGCAGSYKASYVTGAVTKQLTTESHDIYSKEFNEKLDECDPNNNSSVTTKTELDECQGKFFDKADHDKIEVAVKVYYEAAKIHSESMVLVEGSAEERKAATQKILESAMALLSLFPDGENLVKKLKKLTGAR